VLISFHSFAKPLEEERLDVEMTERGIEPVAPGGLFVARSGDQNTNLIVSMSKVDGFQGLLIEPTFVGVPRSKEQALAIMRAVFSWSDARLAGGLAKERRARVVSRLHEHLYGVLCGAKWANAERCLRMNDFSAASVEVALNYFEKKRAFAFVLARDAVKYSHFDEQVRQTEFASLAHRFAVAPGVIPKPALDLTTVLNGGLRPSEAELAAMISHLWDYPVLTAGARIIQLLGKHGGTQPVNAGSSA